MTRHSEKIYAKPALRPLYWLALLLLAVALYLLSFLPRRLSGRYYHFLGRYWCRLFIKALGIELERVYRNKKPLPEHYILIANHPSVLEDFAIPALFDVYPLAKAGVRDWYVLGRMSDYAGTIFVKRGSKDSRKAALQAMLQAVRAGKNLVVFPEGGCKGRRIYHEFKTGAFDVSLQSGVPVLPVFLQYLDEDVFEWTDQSMPRMLWQIFTARDRRVIYHVFDAMLPEDFNESEAFARHAHDCYLQWEQEEVDEKKDPPLPPG
ncbi:MAG TPA: 1-acyl-sn-glycerol-3-phosphate acyltransferase [Gammaproteobacteria bacterium]|nr:1-acyl-sn-glycerol-3-phosphate acyltransferase [Gammaproteobacteria bacterium]